MKYNKWSILVVCALVWLIGIVANITLGGWIHILPIVCVVTGLVFILQSRDKKGDKRESEL